MKKVMIGILILIPILILVIVAAVSNFLKIAAWIAVDDISVVYKNTSQEAESITLMFPDKDENGNYKNIYNFYDYLDIKVFPEYANRYSVEWSISGDVVCMDSKYAQDYGEYLERRKAYDKYLSDVGALDERIRILNEEAVRASRTLENRLNEIDSDKTLTTAKKNELKAQARAEYNEAKSQRDAQIKAANEQKNALVVPDLGVEVEPAAMFIDDYGNEVSSNTSGKLKINSYCRFNIAVQVESITRIISIIAEGYNVESIKIVNLGSDDDTLAVGESMLVDAKYNPMSSIVTKTRWHSDNAAVASVDQNGVITAHSVGEANITVEANHYDNQNVFVASEQYKVKVVAGASKFGTQFSTFKTNFTLSDIGIAADSVNSYDGCGISGELVTFTSDVAHIVTSKGTVTINKCGENDIVIQNAEIYSATNGYVFAVSELTLKLKAVWADALKEGEPDAVVWSAVSQGNIATVDNGEVTASESGLVEIIAERNGRSASIVLNLQLKLVSMTLRTGNAYFAVGLARETVFAAEKYRFENVAENNEKIVNSVLLQIVGAPKRLPTDTDATFNAKLAVFYNAFTYEITDGKEFAYFSDSASEPNRLIFIPSALEGKGKQTIKVFVRAKYPRYESESNYVEEEVDIKVIYGVEVNNIAQFRRAAEDQEAYAKADGNLQPRQMVWEHVNTSDGRADKYKVFNAEYSLRTYGISVMNDLPYEISENGTPLPINDGNSVKIYGDVYGNGHRLSAERNQVEGVNAMLWVTWSHVTVSNLNIRANRMEKDGTLTTDETTGLQGECIQIFMKDKQERNRLIDVRIEFGILENARRAGQIYNGDCVFDGLVIRNIDSTAFYNPARMTVYEEDGELVTYPLYPHLTMNNCVYSNCIQTIGSYAYERFSVVPKTGDSGNVFPDCKAGDGRFIRNDKAKNAEYFKTHFAAAGINIQIRQTGFLDIYNWQNVKNANLMDVGDDKVNDLIGSVAGEIIEKNPAFAKCKYYDPEENALYFHIGLISTGVSFGESIFDEPCYLDVTFEDSRFSDPIRTRELTPLSPKEYSNPLASTAERLFSTFEIVYYGYSSESDITPFSTYEVNKDFIDRLHGLK